MTDPDWAKVLRILYEEGGEVQYHEHKEKDQVKITIPKGSKLDNLSTLGVEEIKNSVDFLEDNGLIEKTGGSPINFTGRIRLKKEGFDVAHEREQNKNREKINKSLVMLTLILAGTALIQALAAIFSLPGRRGTYLAFLSVIILSTVGYGVWNMESVVDRKSSS